MKKNKILSLLMATTMVFSTCVYAFAAPDYNDGHWTDNRGHTEVSYAGEGGKGVDPDKLPDGMDEDDFDDNGEGYLITVPATFELTKGVEAEGEVKVVGFWCSDCTLNVSTPNKVNMTSDITGAEAIDLAIEFNSQTSESTDLLWSIGGDNEEPIDVSSDISVEAMDVLFGTWTGTINYDVSWNHTGIHAASQP